MKSPVFTGCHGTNHIQGIAVDDKNGFIYCSFTTKLIKLTLDGKFAGSVDGLTGHLGCIDFNETDGKVYGSLEFKNDSVGRGIRESLGTDIQFDDAFYMAIFDVDKIDRPEMDAEGDGVMTAAYLREVVEDFNATGLDKAGNTVPHRYGCSGIDGTTVGPMPGAKDGKEYLFVAYGVYGDTSRDDNDHQIILAYDPEELKRTALPLSQTNLHRSGPEKPEEKLFVFTGNTTYGVQNLEYDAFNRGCYMAVYSGEKPEYPNYSLFLVDADKAPELKPLKGLDESGLCLSLKEAGCLDEKTGLRGWHFARGSTGLYARGDGTYLISHNRSIFGKQCSDIFEYAADETKGFIKIKGEHQTDECC